jgi:hypothetical protein
LLRLLAISGKNRKEREALVNQASSFWRKISVAPIVMAVGFSVAQTRLSSSQIKLTQQALGGVHLFLGAAITLSFWQEKRIEKRVEKMAALTGVMVLHALEAFCDHASQFALLRKGLWFATGAYHLYLWYQDWRPSEKAVQKEATPILSALEVGTLEVGVLAAYYCTGSLPEPFKTDLLPLRLLAMSAENREELDRRLSLSGSFFERVHLLSAGVSLFVGFPLLVAGAGGLIPRSYEQMFQRGLGSLQTLTGAVITIGGCRQRPIEKSVALSSVVVLSAVEAFLGESTQWLAWRKGFWTVQSLYTLYLTYKFWKTEKQEEVS